MVNASPTSGSACHGRRKVGVSADAHERIAGTGGEHEFGKIRRKRHDARGVRDIRRGLSSAGIIAGEKRRQRYDEEG